MEPKRNRRHHCYILSTLVLILRYMSRSIVISSFSSSDQFNFTVTKCVVSLSAKCSLEVELSSQNRFTFNYNIKAIAWSATNSGHPLLLCCWSQYLPKDNTLPLRKFLIHMQCQFATSIEFMQVQVSDYSPPPSNSCSSKSVTICCLHRILASPSQWLFIPANPRQCQFAASVEFLQVGANLPPLSTSCKSKPMLPRESLLHEVSTASPNAER